MSDLSTRVLEARNLDDPSAFSAMRQAIIQGQFTPFLGAGASSLRPHAPDLAEHPWSEIWNGILVIRDGLKKPTQLLYLKSFAKQRLRIEGEREKELEPSPEQLLRKESADKQRRRDWPQEDLVDFQRSLVRLATEMGEVFGAAFGRSYMAVSSLSEAAVKIDPAVPECADLTVELLHLVDVAARLPDEAFPAKATLRGRPKPPVLKQQEIYKKLVMLAISMVNTEQWTSEQMKGWRQRHAVIIGAIPTPLATPKDDKDRDGKDRGVTFRPEILEWLPELLWYTLRYWAPCLPTTAEMAFELSLKAYLTPPIKVNLAQAAEATREKPARLAAEICKWFQYCHDRQPKLTSFHVAIAAVLQHMYDMYRKQEEEKAKSQLPAAMGMSSAMLPVAFTTNFDRSLENVFESMNINHHIVFPVRARRGQVESREGKVLWRFCTKYSPNADEKTFDNDISCDELFGEEGDHRMLAGPVIVKLHGSPMDACGPNAEHWLVLSELGYLEALDHRQSKLPDWLEGQLAGEHDSGAQGNERSLWFLGYSISDWNVRLRLYEHLRYSHYASHPNRRAIDRRLDSFRMAILGSLSIELYVGDLNLLPRMILSSLMEIPRGERSDALERLMAWLEEEQK